jgi:hypothetical protein
MKDLAPMPPVEVGSRAGDPFWDSRPELQTIRQHGEASMGSPWALLGVVLASVAEAIPPSVVLPPLGNGKRAYGSLNVFFGIVGNSGQGKGVATQEAPAVIAPAVPTREVRSSKGGTAEGLANDLLKDDVDKSLSPEQQIAERSVRIDLPEIDTLSHLTDRKGSLLEPEMRKIWSGEALGQNNAYKETSREIPPHMYRVTAVVGVQPLRSQHLLASSDGGTLQRFVFLSGGNPDHPDVEPEAPEPIKWTPPYPAVRSNSFTVIRLSPRVKKELADDRRATIREQPTHENGHYNLSRLKIAALLAALAERRDVNDDDWSLAQMIMIESDAQIQKMKSALAAARNTSARGRGMADAERKVAEGDAMTMKAAGKLEAVLKEKGKLPSGGLRTRITASLRDYFDSALHYLEATGKVRVMEAGPTTYVEPLSLDALTLSSPPQIRENTGISGLDDSVKGGPTLTISSPDDGEIVKARQIRQGQDPLEQADRGALDSVKASRQGTVKSETTCRQCGLPFRAEWGNPFCQGHERADD